MRVRRKPLLGGCAPARHPAPGPATPPRDAGGAPSQTPADPPRMRERPCYYPHAQNPERVVITHTIKIPNAQNPETCVINNTRHACTQAEVMTEQDLEREGMCTLERLIIYCQTTGVSAAHAAHCATYCTPCRQLTRAFPGWIRTPPSTCALYPPRAATSQVQDYHLCSWYYRRIARYKYILFNVISIRFLGEICFKIY